jgi:hypothetical protein
MDHISSSADKYKKSLSSLNQKYEIGAMTFVRATDVNAINEMVIPE